MPTHPKPDPNPVITINGVHYRVPIADMYVDSNFVIPTIAKVKDVAKALGPLATYFQTPLLLQEISWFDVLAVRVMRPSSASLPSELRQSL